MESLAMAGLVLPIVALIFALYPIVALGRIWNYSKQQLVELKKIRALLELEGSHT